MKTLDEGLWTNASHADSSGGSPSAYLFRGALQEKHKPKPLPPDVPGPKIAFVAGALLRELTVLQRSP